MSMILFSDLFFESVNQFNQSSMKFKSRVIGWPIHFRRYAFEK